MATNPACDRFFPLLSPFIDGELAPSERVNVERHLAACRRCTASAADLRAASGLLRHSIDLSADEVDFKDFAQKVMARVTPEQPPLLERWKLSLSELFTYHRGAMISSLATAAILLAIGLPLLLKDRTPLGYAAPQMAVETVSIDEKARVAPVVMEVGDGNAIIWLVDSPAGQDEARSEELDMDAPRETTPAQGGEL
jgi:anti-sigma factor RsiW